MSAPVPSAPKVVKLRRYPWDASSEITVVLSAEAPGSEEWTVSLPDADGNIGTVSSYMGTLDRPVRRGRPIRRPGKRRKLWCSSNDLTGTHYGMNSRADAIRWLL